MLRKCFDALSSSNWILERFHPDCNAMVYGAIFRLYSEILSGTRLRPYKFVTTFVPLLNHSHVNQYQV